MADILYADLDCASDPDDITAYMRLWASVMATAVADYNAKDVNLRADARRWFGEDRACIGSLQWMCALFGFSPHRVREKIAQRTKRTPIYKKAGRAGTALVSEGD
jgi:hypothetical protein